MAILIWQFSSLTAPATIRAMGTTRHGIYWVRWKEPAVWVATFTTTAAPGDRTLVGTLDFFAAWDSNAGLEALTPG